MASDPQEERNRLQSEILHRHGASPLRDEGFDLGWIEAEVRAGRITPEYLAWAREEVASGRAKEFPGRRLPARPWEASGR